MGQLRIMGTRGDTAVAYAPDDAASVVEAQRTFDKYVHDYGYAAFAFDAPRAEGVRVQEFLPNTVEYVLVPPMQGGGD